MLRTMLPNFGKLAVGASRSRGAISQLLHPRAMESQLEMRSETMEPPHTFRLRGRWVPIVRLHSGSRLSTHDLAPSISWETLGPKRRT